MGKRWRDYGVLSLIGVVVLARVAFGLSGGYLRVNGGASLKGHVFACWPRKPEETLTVGTLVEFYPTPAIVAQVSGIMPAPILALSWIKRVAAQDGQRVCWDRTLHIDGVERAALPLVAGYHFQTPEGCRTLGTEDVLVLGEHPQSYDGRYFGALRRQDMVATCHLMVP